MHFRIQSPMYIRNKMKTGVVGILHSKSSSTGFSRVLTRLMSPLKPQKKRKMPPNAVIILISKYLELLVVCSICPGS